MNICCIVFFMKYPASLLRLVSMAVSITMATPLCHHLKLNGATPRIGRLLFWVIAPVRHSSIYLCTLYNGRGGDILVADHLFADKSMHD